MILSDTCSIRKGISLSRVYWFCRRSLSGLFGFLHKKELDIMSAVLIFFSIKMYTLSRVLKAQQRGSKTHRVLAFDRETFEKDLAEIAKRTDIDILFFPMFVYGAFFSAFLPVYMKDQMEYHTFNSAEELRLKGILQNACNKVFPALKKWLKFDAMISANIDYAYDQAWVEAGKLNKTPFIALCKEGIQSESHFNHIFSYYKNTKLKFRGDKIAVLCERKKKALILSGVSNARDIIVTGIARSDSLLDSINCMGKSKMNRAEKWAVLFTFKHKFFNAHSLWRDMLCSFARAASGLSSSSNIRFMVKTRDISDKKETEKMLRKYGLLEYVSVEHNISFAEIVNKAVLAVGYNTTSIVEMMATDIPIIVPHWAEAEEHQLINMLDVDKNTSAYHLAVSPGILMNSIEYYLLNRADRRRSVETRNARDKIVEKFIYKIDSKRSLAIADMIKQSITCTN